MKIAVIGTFVLDQIHTYEGKIVESLGGISYSIAILANLFSDKDEIYPIANVGFDGYDKITNFLSQFQNVRIKGLYKENKKNTRVTLKYYNQHSREEFLQHLLSPIHFNQILRIGKFDIILINFITGFELSSETCNEICNQSDILKYMDFHSLCLGIDDQGKRYPRKPENWKQWLIGVDILQMNENEALILNDHFEISDLGFKLVKESIGIVNITLGAKGSLLFTNQNETMLTREFPAYRVSKVVDVTGCGDAFAGGFIAEYIKSKDIVKSVINANKIAGINSTLSGIEYLNLLSRYKNC